MTLGNQDQTHLWEEEGVNCLQFSGKVSKALISAEFTGLGPVCALETFLKAISDNWLERKLCWRDSRRKWEGVQGGLSDVLSYCSLSRSIDLFTESLCLLCAEPPAVLRDSRLKLISGSSLSQLPSLAGKC